MSETTQTNIRHSAEIDEIITKVPAWIVRWGIVLFAGILIFVLSVTAFIPSPETIKLPVKLEVSGNEVFAQVRIRQDMYAKIRTGQHAVLHLDVYAANPGASFKGDITNIAVAPDNSGFFLVGIKISRAPNTLPLKSWMTGSAEIVTDNKTVLQRLTRNLIKI